MNAEAFGTRSASVSPTSAARGTSTARAPLVPPDVPRLPGADGDAQTTVSPSVSAQHGNVDRNGEIVDLVILDRLRSAIGEFRSVDVDLESQLLLTVRLLSRGVLQCS